MAAEHLLRLGGLPGGQEGLAALDSATLRSIRLDAGSERPLYAQVADFLGELMRRDFDDEDLFFTEQVLVDCLPVSQVTIRRAMRELAGQGLVVRTRGRGTVVRKHGPAPARAANGSVDEADVTVRRTNSLAGERKKLRSVGIFRPAHMVPFSEHGSALMEEFRSQCEAKALECRFYDTTDADSVLRSFAQIKSHPDEEGFVLHTTVDATVMLYHSLANRGFQSVAMEGASEIYPGWVVETDAAEAARIGMRHLVDLGHRRIVLLVNEPAAEPTVIEKIDAFKEFARSAGLHDTCRVVLCEAGYGDLYETAYNHMAEAISGEPASRPTAIMTASDPGAWAALKWCSQNALRVPNDLSILEFEDARSSKYMIPAVSSIAHPRQRLVETVLEVLSGGMSGPSRRIFVPPVLMARESTGRAPGSKRPARREAAGFRGGRSQRD